jgi:hypothetical protein
VSTCVLMPVKARLLMREKLASTTASVMKSARDSQILRTLAEGTVQTQPKWPIARANLEISPAGCLSARTSKEEI